ncbi:MAG: hypothetical protein R3280_00090 [Marinobacter sp.]|uniref:hypothetical protein n=1 Tax=Marinobacter sp. TaxID=50741 RepID=UPI00299F003A|nr:hypothetical protein [Marinobacter sp.]MDX1633011.1 hypothetical protein [Marinobacter sp.]
MDTTTIVIFFAVIVFVSIGIIVLSQMREKARIERARKVTALEDSYNRANRLLTEIPGQYLTRELKLLLINRIEEICRELEGLRADLPVRQWRSDVQTLKQQIVDGNDERTPTKIDSPEKSAYVKELLQSLFKMIESLHKSGRIDSATAKKNLKHVLFLVHKTHADMHVFQARDYIRQNEIRKAIHAYHLASTEMGKSRDNPLALKAVKSFRTRIKELEASLNGGGTTEPQEKQHRLDKEWDNFLHEDEWKKKADYDD